LVRVGHVGVGPHDDLAPGPLGADPADGAGSAVAVEVHDLQVRVVGRDLVQAGQGLIRGGVVERQQFVAGPAAVHGRADLCYLVDDVVLLVIARQDDRDIRIARWRNAHGGRGYYCLRRLGAGPAGREGYYAGSDIQTSTLNGRVCVGGAVSAFSS